MVVYPLTSSVVNTLLAATDPAGGSSLPDPITALLPYLNLGIIVLLVIMIITKKGFVPKWVLDDQEKQNDEAVEESKRAHERELAEVKAALTASTAREEEYKRLNSDLQTYQRDQLQPALIETTRVVAQYAQALARRGEV